MAVEGLLPIAGTNAHLHKLGGSQSGIIWLFRAICLGECGSSPGAGCAEALQTCGREEGSCQVVRVGEPWEDSRSRGSAEQVQLPIHVQLVRVQLHLLELRAAQRGGEGDKAKGMRTTGSRAKTFTATD